MLLIAYIACFQGVSAQTTAFNFQGRLNDGTNPANGHYDLQFKLFDALIAGNQIGSMIDRPDLVLVNGVFSTALDFGASAFGGGDRFIEMAVRPHGSPNPHVILGSRQQISSAPYSVRAANATQADNAANAQNAVNAQNSIFATNAQTAQNSLSLGGAAAANYPQLNQTNIGSLSASNISSTGDLIAAGKLLVNGNTVQVAASHGFVKAMIAVTANGAIARCYNGSTGSSTVPCDFSVQPIQTGRYFVTFPFSVSDRFWIVTSDDSSGSFGVNVASVGPVAIFPNRLEVRRFLDGSGTDLPFHLFVY